MSKEKRPMLDRIEAILRAEETADLLPPWSCLPVGDTKWIELKAKRIEPLIQQAEMKGWRKGNELKQKRLDIKLKMAKAREIFEEIEEEIKTAEAKQIEANNDVENPERYPNERYWQGYEHATRFIGQSIKSKYMEGR